MTTTHEYTGTLAIIECCNCHMDFGMTAALRASLKESHGVFYCPAGHRQHFTRKSDLEVAREQRDQASRTLVRERAEHDQTRADLRETELRRRAEKGAKTRMKNRVAKGVCPCCNRSFANLGAHMAQKHPDFTEESS